MEKEREKERGNSTEKYLRNTGWEFSKIYDTQNDRSKKFSWENIKQDIYKNKLTNKQLDEQKYLGILYLYCWKLEIKDII